MATVGLSGAQQKALAFGHTYLEVWFWNGRAYVGLSDVHTHEPILGLCDDEVDAAMKRRGILGRSPARWFERMINHVLENQLIQGKMWVCWLRKERTECGGS